MPPPHYLRDLNPEQTAAVMATDGPVLVLAGAGSGKTRMLVYRIAHLIRGGVNPRRVLAVTFTNRAAGEMRERVAKVVGREARGVTLSTFHSLGARILREHGTAIGLPERFSIYATSDQLAMIRRIVAEEVHVVATAGEDQYDAKRVMHQISSWKNQMTSPVDAKREVAVGRTMENRSDDYDVLAADVYGRYEEALRAAGACDFDDLLLLPVKLLRDHADAREAVWRRWHYVMIDEYQDTNGAQLEMARLLAGPRKNLCVVGDDDQSIYAWRGADLTNILDFERHYPGAQVIILEENYRSTQRILDAANAVIAHNVERKPKAMRTMNGPGPMIDYWELCEERGRSAEEIESDMVAREIGVRRFHEKLQWGDFGVLYRTNLQARPLEEALRTANIPYRVVGGTSYFDRKEIADAVAYLRLVVNPRDEMSLRRIINYPTRGIGRVTLLRLVEAARKEGVGLWDVLEGSAGIDGISAAQANAISEFVTLMNGARSELARIEAAIRNGRSDGASLEGWAEGFLRSLRLEEAVRAENKSEKVADIRIDNLRNFVAAIGNFERRTWADEPLPDDDIEWSPPTLGAFLESVSLDDPESDDSRDESEDEMRGRVTLMTLHSAKGLEFTHVFLVGLEEEILPHARSVAEIGNGSADPLAEERRLFYVGVTRARHRLTLSGCRSRRRGAETLPRQPSRFLKEILTELLDVHSPGTESSLSQGDRKELRE
ncbi:MAG TPA: UvrD-helicase domain-containing protein, partial [Longimicrobiaceae bacterium]|nr:UvrD-helicase domain-containing protein [Longimicrobiaceae bacterium]